MAETSSYSRTPPTHQREPARLFPVRIEGKFGFVDREGTNGIKSEGAFSNVRLSNTTITDNNTGLLSASSGVIATFGNNYNAGNSPGGNGAPTQAVTPKQ